jgi:DnaK suppressor protein
MADWSELKSRLLAMKDETRDRLSDTGQYGLDDSFRDELSELSLYDNHPADVASEVFERGKDVALRASDNRRLQHIDDALQAIDNGTYGTCRHCGQPIPRERLEAQPTASLCVHCKDEEEDRHPDRMRPIEEEFLWPGFARSNLDDTSATYFDGEDSWQAVARYDELPGIETDGYADMDDNEGIVDPMDGVSNELYKRNRLS